VKASKWWRVVTTKDGDKRALSSALQNVLDAWMTLLGQPLSNIETQHSSRRFGEHVLMRTNRG